MEESTGRKPKTRIAHNNVALIHGGYQRSSSFSSQSGSGGSSTNCSNSKLKLSSSDESVSSVEELINSSQAILENKMLPKFKDEKPNKVENNGDYFKCSNVVSGNHIKLKIQKEKRESSSSSSSSSSSTSSSSSESSSSSSECEIIEHETPKIPKKRGRKPGMTNEILALRRLQKLQFAQLQLNSHSNFNPQNTLESTSNSSQALLQQQRIQTQVFRNKPANRQIVRHYIQNSLVERPQPKKRGRRRKTPPPPDPNLPPPVKKRRGRPPKNRQIEHPIVSHIPPKEVYKPRPNLCPFVETNKSNHQEILQESETVQESVVWNEYSGIEYSGGIWNDDIRNMTIGEPSDEVFHESHSSNNAHQLTPTMPIDFPPPVPTNLPDTILETTQQSLPEENDIDNEKIMEEADKAEIIESTILSKNQDISSNNDKLSQYMPQTQEKDEIETCEQIKKPSTIMEIEKEEIGANSEKKTSSPEPQNQIQQFPNSIVTVQPEIENSILTETIACNKTALKDFDDKENQIMNVETLDKEKIEENTTSKNKLESIDKPLAELKIDEPIFDWNEFLQYKTNLIKIPNVTFFKHAPLADIWKDLTKRGQIVKVENAFYKDKNNVGIGYWFATAIASKGYKMLVKYIDLEEDQCWLDWIEWSTAKSVNSDVNCRIDPGYEIKSKFPNWKIKIKDILEGKPTISTNHKQIFEESFLEERRIEINNTFVCNIEIGTYLEATDPLNLDCTRIGTIISIVGSRILISYLDSSKKDDRQWFSIHSDKIHPIGWSEHVGVCLNGVQVQDTFNSKKIDEKIFSEASPSPDWLKENSCFEACHPVRSAEICPAKIIKVLKFGYFIAEFIEKEQVDSNTQTTKCLFHISSPYIFQCGWAKTRNLVNSSVITFEWNEYLKNKKLDTLSLEENFPLKPSHKFKPGMKLEAPEVNNPSLFGPATIEQIKDHLLLISHDGKPNSEKWISADSPDIYPIGYCKMVGQHYNYKRPIQVS